MFCIFRELRFRPLVGGILSYAPGLYEWWDNRRPTGNATSAAYVESIWQFHLSNMRQYNNVSAPSVVVELGPGASLGSCITALRDGADKAIGLDAYPYADNSELNHRILDELMPERQNEELYNQLLKDIGELHTKKSDARLRLVAPWTDIHSLPECSVDFIFSHSVLEHVTRPADAYKACFKWLKPGGMMSHKIDHSSHAITRSWNGHYAIPAWIWNLVHGGKPYLLNRLSPLEHRTLIHSAGFEILSEQYVEAREADDSSACKTITANPDWAIKTSTFVCRKNI